MLESELRDSEKSCKELYTELKDVSSQLESKEDEKHKLVEKLDLRREQMQKLISEKKQVEVIDWWVLWYKLTIQFSFRRNFQISRVDLLTHRKPLLPVKIKHSSLQKSSLLTNALYLFLYSQHIIYVDISKNVGNLSKTTRK